MFYHTNNNNADYFDHVLDRELIDSYYSTRWKKYFFYRGRIFRIFTVCTDDKSCYIYKVISIQPYYDHTYHI